ncbi:hypothetical protein OPKNFCMD_5175 [Methylobacterium crusticola]|uniref:Uncharacterized protein n=1 Tax=Methylobacterium crusticola TaxID=1697972 RepID=A0ABQ4R3Z5_9HYPH|nr:hypothetical protein OPKNFCMD_5175 [Methylobacterium crusticola]
MPAVSRVSPAARQVWPAVALAGVSARGAMRQDATRRSLPCQATTSETWRQAGASAWSWSRAAGRSGPPETVFCGDRVPRPVAVTGSVAYTNSPMAGISVTAVTRSSRAGPASRRVGRRMTSAVMTGTRLPKGARGRSSNTR